MPFATRTWCSSPPVRKTPLLLLLLLLVVADRRGVSMQAWEAARALVPRLSLPRLPKRGIYLSLVLGCERMCGCLFVYVGLFIRLFLPHMASLM
jgi:hypothetical protein